MPAVIFILSALFGLAFASTRHLDGAQTFIVCLFVWLVLSSLYHGARATVLGRRRRR